MPQVPTRTLRDYFADLAAGQSAAVVGQNLNLRTDLATMAQAVPNGGTTGQVLGKVSNGDLDIAWTTAGVGDMLKAIYDPQNKNADAFARANQTGTQSYTTITGLGTAAQSNAGDFATSAQGALADSAIQPNTTQTLTNKRITQRVFTVGSTATLTPDADTVDMVAVTAQAVTLTIAAPTGTPTDGQRLIVRIRDNGTSRTIAWNAAYQGYVGDLPAATFVGRSMLYEFLYNSTLTIWELLSGNPIPGKFGP